jgi:hypothetical protein
VIDEALLHHGVECNYVNGEWSGVSSERYRKIIRLTASSFHHTLSASDGVQSPEQGPNDALLVLLSFLWERAKTKRCLLDYLVSLDRELLPTNGGIFVPEYEQLRIENSEQQKLWLQDQYVPLEITDRSVAGAAKMVVPPTRELIMKPCVGNMQMLTPAACGNPQPHLKEELSASTVGSSFDVLAGSFGIDRSSKLPIRLGRYTYGDGVPRPDCVEVVVREIIDTLIYGMFLLFLLLNQCNSSRWFYVFSVVFCFLYSPLLDRRAHRKAMQCEAPCKYAPCGARVL